MCVRRGISRKQREYDYLYDKNSNGIRLDSLEDFYTEPCGRLTMRLVFKDMGYTNEEFRQILRRCKDAGF